MKFFKSSAVALAVLILVVAAGSVYGLSRKPLEVQLSLIHISEPTRPY